MSIIFENSVHRLGSFYAPLAVGSRVVQLLSAGGSTGLKGLRWPHFPHHVFPSKSPPCGLSLQQDSLNFLIAWQLGSTKAKGGAARPLKG